MGLTETPYCRGLMRPRNLLCGAGRPTQWSVITHMGRENGCVYVGMIHSAVHLKLIPPRKSTLVP